MLRWWEGSGRAVNKGWWGPRCRGSRSLFIIGLAGLLRDSTHSMRKKYTEIERET